MIKFQLFCWKSVTDVLPTKGKLRHISMHVDCKGPFSNKEEQTINHIFINYDFAVIVWSTIGCYCPTPTNLRIAIWVEYIWTHKNWHSKTSC